MDTGLRVASTIQEGPPMRRKSKTNVAPIDHRASSLAVFPFPCPNCDSAVANAALFCSELCRDEAKFVRYYRARIFDGTLWRDDIREAIQIKRAHILSGGYEARARLVPDDIRRKAIQRDGGRCRECGRPGTEIDHIRGGGSALNNLQLLCSDCHRQKTMLNLQRISPDEHSERWAKAKALEERAMATEPLRLCDSENWNSIWRDIRTARLTAFEAQNA